MWFQKISIAALRRATGNTKGCKATQTPIIIFLEESMKQNLRGLGSNQIIPPWEGMDIFWNNTM